MKEGATSLGPVGRPAGVIEMECNPDRILLIPPSSAQVIVLVDTAAELWRLMGRGLTVDEIAGAAASTYGVDVDAILPQVRGFVEDLRRRGVATLGTSS